jgi:hypothetical protein
MRLSTKNSTKENGGSTAVNGGNGAAGGASDGSRIPKTLQAVFLASNRGNDVHKPPPKQVAFRTFFRNWLGTKPATNGEIKEKKGRNNKKNHDTKTEQEKMVANSYQKGKSKSNSNPMKPPKPVKKVCIQ